MRRRTLPRGFDPDADKPIPDHIGQTSTVDIDGGFRIPRTVDITRSTSDRKIKLLPSTGGIPRRIRLQAPHRQREIHRAGRRISNDLGIG